MRTTLAEVLFLSGFVALGIGCWLPSPPVFVVGFILIVVYGGSDGGTDTPTAIKSGR